MKDSADKLTKIYIKMRTAVSEKEDEIRTFHLLEKRISTLAMKQFLEDNPDLMPVGLQATRKYVVSVLKPRKK
jgi:hypothetical protein